MKERASTMVSLTLPVIVLLALVTSPKATGAQRRRVIRGIEAMRLLQSRGRHVDVERFGYSLLWKDLRKPEVLYRLAGSLDKLGRNEDAAVYYTYFLRVLEEKEAGAKGSSAVQGKVRTKNRFESPSYRAKAKGRLKTLDQNFQKQRVEYVAQAAAKHFTTPKAVSDLWMTQINAYMPFGLHDAYAWRLVGGRKGGVPAKWIHNEQGVMHRSGLKRVSLVEGRKGVLYVVLFPLSYAQKRGLDHTPQIAMENIGKCRFLRLGIKGYGLPHPFPFVLNIHADGEKVFTQTLGQAVGRNEWVDLKVDLKRGQKISEHVVVELVIPETQHTWEGAWIDYMDFFEN